MSYAVMTVGYSDMYPTSDAAQIFTAIFSLVGISFLGVALGVIGNKLIEYQMSMIAQADKAEENQVLSLLRGEEKGEGKGESGSKPTACSGFFVPGNAILVRLKKYAPIFSILLLGSFFMAYTEGWSWKKAVYFCTMTATTVGEFLPYGGPLFVKRRVTLGGSMTLTDSLCSSCVHLQYHV